MGVSSKEWLFVLLNENGASYYIDSMGAVNTSLEPKPLKNMFEGWQDIQISYGRSSKYFGLERSYTSSYTFVEEAAKILRNLTYNDRSLESKVYFGLLKWGDTTGEYELYYKAEVDLSQAVDTPNSWIVTEVIQDGPAKYIKNNDNIVYDIDCEDLIVDIDGLRYSEKANFEIADVDIQEELQVTLPFTFINKEGLSSGVALTSQNYEVIPPGSGGSITGYLSSSYNTFFTNYTTPVSLKLEGVFVIENKENVAQSVAVLNFKSQADTTWIVFSGSVAARAKISVPVNLVINTYIGDRLFLIWDTAVQNNRFSFAGSKITIKFDTRFKATEAKAQRPLNVFKALVDKMTDGRYKGASTLLASNAHLVVLAGDSVRGVPKTKIKTTFSSFFDSYSKILRGAIGVDHNTQTVIFEERSFFVNKNTLLLDLGEVAELTIEAAKDLLFNSIKTGYADNKIEEALAREEVNAGQIYTTPITRVKKEYSLLIPYRTDIFGIEDLRQRYYQITEKDAAADNSVFILNIARTPDLTGHYRLFRAAYASILGGSNLDTWYNIEQLTPKRLLLANADIINSGLHYLPTEKIKFRSADKNAELSTFLDGVTVSEKADVRISELGAPLFRPFLLKFKTKIPENVVTLLQQAAGGFIKGKWKGVEFFGFAQELSVKPIFDEAQEWTLLCSSQTDTAIFETINNEGLIIPNMGILSHKLPVKFIKVGVPLPAQYHFKQMDADWFSNRIGRYSQQQNYYQKWQTDDSFDIQFIVQNVSSSLVVIDCYGATVATIPLTEVSNPSVKSPYQLITGTVSCAALAPGIYYLLATFGVDAGAVQFITEPMLVNTDHRETVLISYGNSKNQTDIIWDAPFVGKFRIEGFIQDFLPAGRLTQYEDQPLEMVNLDGVPTRSYELLIGSDFGVPDWIIDKLNRILMLSDITIDGFAYTLDKGAKLEAIQSPGAPMSYWSIRIREANNAAGISIDGSGIANTPITVVYNINTKGFSSNQSPADQTGTLVQVTEIE